MDKKQNEYQLSNETLKNMQKYLDDNFEVFISENTEKLSYSNINGLTNSFMFHFRIGKFENNQIIKVGKHEKIYNLVYSEFEKITDENSNSEKIVKSHDEINQEIKFNSLIDKIHDDISKLSYLCDINKSILNHLDNLDNYPFKYSLDDMANYIFQMRITNHEIGKKQIDKKTEKIIKNLNNQNSFLNNEKNKSLKIQSEEN